MPASTTICAPTAAAVPTSSTFRAPTAASEEPNILFDPTHQTQPSPTDDNLYDSSDSENEEGLFKRAKMDFGKSQSRGQRRRDNNDYVDDSDTLTSGDNDDNVDVNDDGTTTKTWTFLILCEIYRTYTKKKSALLQQLRIKNHTSSAPLLSATRRDRHNLFFSITNGLAFALRGPDPVNDDHQVDPAAQSPDATNVTCASIIGNDAGGNGKPNASNHTPKHEYTPRRSGDRDQHRSRERPSQPWTRTPPTPGAPL